MLVAGNIELRVLLVFVVFPIIGFLIWCKWRLSIARKEEFDRLLVLLASEEASRAELESFVVHRPSLPIASSHQCTVCYCPTTTRCSRCKSVRYCSGKCQIIHWRQGHKENCHPPSISNEAIASGTNFKQKVSEQDNYESSASESSVTSFSGFSTSAVSSESSDETSTTDSSSQTEPEKFDGYMCADATPNPLEITRGIDINDQAEPLSPMFTYLVDSVDIFSSSCKLNQLKPGGTNEKELRSSSKSSGFLVSDNHKGYGTVSSDFWARTLDHNEHISEPFEDNSRKLDSQKSSSSSSSSFNLFSPLDAYNSEAKHTSNAALSGASENKRPLDVEGLSKVNVVSSNACNSIPLNYQSKKGNSARQALNSNEVKSSSASSFPSNNSGGKSLKLNASISQTLRSERSSKTAVDPVRTISKVKSKDVEILSRRRIDSDCSPSAGRPSNSLSCSQLGKVDIIQATPGVPSQLSYSPTSKNSLRTSMQKVVDQFKGSKLLKNNQASTDAEVSGRLNYKGLFSYDHFAKLYTWNKFELLPAGLVNCGNSCFANVVLQCLAFTPPLTAYFLQGLHSKSCTKKGWCFNCEFESLVLKVKEGRSSPLSPVGIISQLQSIGSQLGNGREEDAHEFLRYAIDAMQSICCKESGVSSSGSWEEETTLIGLTFGGYLLSKIKCTRCQGRTERQERIMDLTVEIEGDIGRLEEALRKFTSTEILDGDNKYQCARCKSYVRAKKKLKILEAPNILTIVLKRFQSGNFGKLNKPIKFPEILNMAPFVSGKNDKSAIYQLYGVVVHLDVTNSSFSGHYVCYVKNSKNKWFKIDDSTVTAVELETVMMKGAYMLLYSRCSPRAPRLVQHRFATPEPKNRTTHARTDERNAAVKPGTTSTHLRSHSYTKNPPGGPGSIDSFQFGLSRVHRIFEDSSSDNMSLISNTSDEGSYSTESTRYSTSADELSDYIFGNTGRMWGTLQNRSDSDLSTSSSSSSSSPSSLSHFNFRNSPLADLDRYSSAFSGSGGSQAAVGTDGDKSSGSGSRGITIILRSDSTRRGRNMTTSSSSRETINTDNLGCNNLNHVKSSSVSIKKSTEQRIY